MVKTIFMLIPLPRKTERMVLRAVQQLRIRLASRGCSVMRIHSDRGSEFINDTFGTWCRSEGIRLTHTAADDPMSNGSAERGVGKAKAEGRVSLIAAGLGVTAWPWAVRHWDACQWASAFDLPQPLRFGLRVNVRCKDWKLLNAFDPRMLPVFLSLSRGC
jgi:hypothetical protein